MGHDGRRAGRHEPASEYLEVADFHWSERAYELLVSGELKGRAFAQGGAVSSHVWGPCPRCGHALDERRVHTAVITGIDRIHDPTTSPGGPSPRPSPTLKVDVGCGCGHTHPNAPGNTTGCGVSFRVELTLPQAAP